MLLLVNMNTPNMNTFTRALKLLEEKEVSCRLRCRGEREKAQRAHIFMPAVKLLPDFTVPLETSQGATMHI